MPAELTPLFAGLYHTFEYLTEALADYSDARPVEDILWSDEWCRAVYAEAGLEPVRVECPLARGDEGVAWQSETTVAPWAIYVLRPL